MKTSTTTKTRKPIIELKSIKHFAAGSQETHCYTANIYVNNNRWGTVENAGHGGPDNVHAYSGGWKAVNALSDLIKETYPRRKSDYFPDGMPESLETICCERVNEWLRAKHEKARVKKIHALLKRRLVATKGGAIYQWPTKYKPTAEMCADFEARDKGEHRLLNQLPPAEAVAIIIAIEDKDD